MFKNNLILKKIMVDLCCADCILCSFTDKFWSENTTNANIYPRYIIAQYWLVTYLTQLWLAVCNGWKDERTDRQVTAAMSHFVLSASRSRSEQLKHIGNTQVIPCHCARL